MKKLIIAASLSILAAGVATAAPPAPKKEGIEGKSYQWNAQDGEKVEALTKKGDKKRGEQNGDFHGGVLFGCVVEQEAFRQE